MSSQFKRLSGFSVDPHELDISQLPTEIQEFWAQFLIKYEHIASELRGAEEPGDHWFSMLIYYDLCRLERKLAITKSKVFPETTQDANEETTEVPT